MAVDLGVAAQPSVGPPVRGSASKGRGQVPGWMRRTAVHLGVIAVFTLPAVALWWRAWSGGPSATVRCQCVDPGQQVWFIAWPAYALSHAIDPLFTDWLWPPHGVNLLANASAPLVGSVLSPITWVFGPFVATTVALTLAPGLSAWGCWIACRRLVSWQPACWVAGFVFGYSPVVVTNLGQGHFSVGLLVIPPLILAVLHEILIRQRWSAMRCGIALAGLVVLQFFISAEVLTIAMVVSAVGILIAALLSPRRAAAAAPFALRAFGIAVLAAIVVLALPVWRMTHGPQHIKGSIWSGLQAFFTAAAFKLWNPVAYRNQLWPGAVTGPPGEFLGFGTLALFVVAVAATFRRRAMWVLAGVAVVSTVLSWGSVFYPSPTSGTVSGLLPWGHALGLPLLENVSPKNFAVMTDLAVALVIGIGLDALRQGPLGVRLRPAGRFIVTAVVVGVAMVPVWLTYDVPLSVQRVNLPPWYTTAALHVPEGSVVTSYPFPASVSVMSTPMVWQAADGMRFRLAGGYVKVPAADGEQGTLGLGPPNSATRTLDELTSPVAGTQLTITPARLTNLRAALVSWDTSYIVVVDQYGAVGAAALFTAATGELPQVVHRAWVWDLRARPLRTAFDADAAAAAYGACFGHASGLGEVASGHPLPQTDNRCIAASD
jgi:hypothetical protein